MNYYEKLNEIKSLKEGWDGEDADVILEDSYENSKKFLEKISESNLNLHFELNPCRDGSIDFDFESALINVDGKRLKFYLDPFSIIFQEYLLLKKICLEFQETLKN